MGAPPPGSQVAPFPSNVPFRIVSKTIGSGAYASIRKAVPPNRSSPVVAIKFINKEHALRVGRLTPKQIQLEISLHASVSPHQNIIQYLRHGEDAAWYWVMLELADGGDLFDKIEADEGVGEEVAHAYFKQLINAVAWCHSKGVAHRDIKPENMLLTANGDLKLADFGLASNYLNIQTGQEKPYSRLVCGSPPYIAPEIIHVGRYNEHIKSKADKIGYHPPISDIWSCAIVLFVLLAGNTPWDQAAADQSEEFSDFVQTHGHPEDELWAVIPPDVLSLLRGLLRVEPRQRFTLQDIRAHPWFTQPNKYLDDKGKMVDSITLATSMMERLHVDFSSVPASQPRAMDMESQNQAGWTNAFASTQPETPIADMPFDWEAPPRLAAYSNLSASQPTTAFDRTNADLFAEFAHQLSQDPTMSQFTQTHQIPLTLTQAARKFTDIAPAHSLTKFFTSMPLSQLLSLLQSALHQINIPTVLPLTGGSETVTYIRVKTFDGRKQPLMGDVIVERINTQGLIEVRFAKLKGDPLEWRRLFKKVAAVCGDAVLKPRNV